MKKVQIKKNKKTLLIAVNVILIGVIAFLLYRTISNPGTTEEKISLYDYETKTDVKYEVLLKPNILYEEESLDENNIFFSELTDKIQSKFSYEFNGEREANINVDYQILGVVEGYNNAEEGDIILWNKVFVLEPKQNIKTNDKKVLFTKNISFSLKSYEDFAKEVVEMTKVKCGTRLSIVMNGELKAQTDKGTINEKISSALVIPLSNSTFRVIKSGVEEKEGSIEDTRVVNLPVNRKLVNSYVTLLVILVMAFAFLIFFTSAIVEEDIIKSNLDKIFKKHGNRLIAINSYIENSYKNYTKIKTMDDLIRIADEICKPVMYKYSPDYKRITKFYTFDDTWMYVFDLKEYLSDTNEKNTTEDNIYADNA